MPRDGSGASDNAIEPGHNITHGDAGGVASTGVDRSHKAAPAPDHEKGEGLDGEGASGGGSAGAPGNLTGDGKGPLEPAAEKEAKKH